jgi:hypothetical protein
MNRFWSFVPVLPSPSSPSPRRAHVRARTWLALGAIAAFAASGLAGACKANDGGSTFDTSGGDATSAQGGTGPAGQGGATSTGTGSGQGGDLFGDAGAVGNPIEITPKSPIMKIELPLAGQTIQFQCVDSTTKQPVAALWKLSAPDLGQISPTGLFTPTGKTTGQVDVSCESGKAKAKTTLTVLIHAMDNIGGISPQDQQTLAAPAPGAGDVGWKFLYPYDKTVFPRGILAPEIQLAPGNNQATEYYVHIVTKTFEYEGFFNANANQTRLQMSQAAWDALTSSAGGTSVDVQISKLYNGQKYGPIFRSWTLAKGTLHGTVYYNTYNSPLAGQTGAMMRIKGNSPTPEVLVGNCTVCHSIGSDGSTAAAANHSGQGGVFDLSNGNVNPPLVWTEAERAAFAGIYPKNGEVLVINAAPGGSWPPNTPGTSVGPYKSELRSKQGALIPSSGIESYYAQSPVFSHDGTMLAFNDRQPNNQNGQYPGKLALLAYDHPSHKFSNYQLLATPQQGHQVAWPAFTPDNRFVVYQDGVGEDLATWNQNTGKIYAVDVQSKQVVFLGALNGDGYMPAGARDENLNYEPTIAPVASGGYIWVMFTSRRTYGNELTGDRSETKRLWVSAFDINPQPGADPSHPAFYVPGQEMQSGNSRGFWALDPCKQDGQGCEGGDECCNGYCSPQGNPPSFICAPPQGGCSQEFDNCKTAADCCGNQNLKCIGEKCTFVPPN